MCHVKSNGKEIITFRGEVQRSPNNEWNSTLSIIWVPPKLVDTH